MPKVMAYIDGAPVGSGMLTLPVSGFSKLAGICTLQVYRCCGVATQVVAHLLQIARTSISLAYRTAADDAAARICMCAGFAATGLTQTNIGKADAVVCVMTRSYMLWHDVIPCNLTGLRRIS